MKSLKEALLNRPKNIDVARMAAEEYINANYKIKGNLTFETVSGVCVVSCDGDVDVKYEKIKKLNDYLKKVKDNIDCLERCQDILANFGFTIKYYTDLFKLEHI